MYEAYEPRWAPEAPTEDREPITAARLLVVLVGCPVLLAASAYSSLLGLVASVCGIDDTPWEECPGDWVLFAGFGVAAALLAAASVLGGVVLRRWWGWCMPVWFIAAGISMILISGLFV